MSPFPPPLILPLTFPLDPDMSLDPVTGLDPEGIKVRAAGGLESIDRFTDLPGQVRIGDRG